MHCAYFAPGATNLFAGTHAQIPAAHEPSEKTRTLAPPAYKNARKKSNGIAANLPPRERTTILVPMSITIELPDLASQTSFNLTRWTEILADPELARLPYRIETDQYGRCLLLGMAAAK